MQNKVGTGFLKPGEERVVDRMVELLVLTRGERGKAQRSLLEARMGLEGLPEDDPEEGNWDEDAGSEVGS